MECITVLTSSNYRVAVIDALVVVQKIVAQDKKAKKDKRIKTCSDFSAAFVNKIESMTRTFHEVRIVFDYYDEVFLKNATRSKGGNSVAFSSAVKHASCSITVFSPDTDVVCLLVAFKERMIQNVHMDTGNHIICIDPLCRSIGEDKARALLSF